MNLFKKLFFALLYVFFANPSLADVLPSYSYSEIYLYDNQDPNDPLVNHSFSDSERISDPFKTLNRHIFNLNYIIDRGILNPISQTYIKIVPNHAQKCTRNFLNNIGEPINVANNLLQGKFNRAFTSFARFFTNSFLGFFGILDVASGFNLKYYGEDLGQTLAKHRVPSGPYLVIPILGSTSSRDIIGKVGDYFINPFSYVLKKDARNAINGLTILQKRSDADTIINSIYSSLDPYETAKLLYIQNRVKQIRE